MDVVVNLRNQIASSQIQGKHFKILGKELFEVFFSQLNSFSVDKLYLIVTNDNDLLFTKIKEKFDKKFRIEAIVSAKLSDASLLKRISLNKKLKDNFIYFSQLSFNDIDLQDFIDFHKYNDSFFTVALAKQPRSFTNYGYVYIDENEKIKSFNYMWMDEQTLFGYINTGIYAISKKAIAEIRNQNNGIKLIDDLLKHIVYKDKRNYTYIFNKYHNNLSTLQEYYTAHVDLLNGTVKNPLFNIDAQTSTYIPKEFNVNKQFKYSAPVMVSSSCNIGTNVTLINSIIAGSAKIGNNVIIENSFIGEEVRIDDNCKIQDSYLWNQFIPSNSYINGNEN